jgi:hypothetical protein
VAAGSHAWTSETRVVVAVEMCDNERYLVISKRSIRERAATF